MDSRGAISYMTRHDWHESKLGLSRMRELLFRMGNPHKKLEYVHVAGTNGKGSVCAMLASVLTAAGYKTGLYTSPYINSFNERIQIDGVSLSDDDLAHLTETVREEAEQMDDHPTEFELVTAVAFQHFYDEGCDIVVLEVGLGGRLDATNIIPAPKVAVITPISLDHTTELGNTVAKIAVEKAGIIKDGCTVVSAPQTLATRQVIEAAAARCQSPFELLDVKGIMASRNTLAGQQFSYKGYKELAITLLGSYQPQNAALVVETIEQLRHQGYQISELALREGLAEAKWPARFEVLSQNPWFIVDGGHNPQCVDCLVENLNTYFPQKKVTFITGVMADKDFSAMFGKIIPLAKRVFTVTPDNPRALDAEELAIWFYANGAQDVQACESVEQGVQDALEIAENEEVICAFGSFFMAGAIRSMFGLG